MNTTIDSPLGNFTESEARIIGIILFCEILICYIPYCCVLAIFIKSPKFQKHVAYQIMVGVGIADLIELTGWGIMAVMMILNQQFSFIFGKVTGALVHTGWQGMVLFSVVLAINRSDAIIGFLPLAENKKNCFWKKICIFTYCIILLLLIINLSPNMGVIMDYLIPQYEKHWNQYNIKKINSTISLILFGICIILYIISFGCLIRQSLKGTFKVSLDTLLFIQTIAITMIKCFISIMWTYWIPPTNFVLVICFVINVLEPGYHPYLYLIFNKRLRKEFKRIFSARVITSAPGALVT